MTDRRNYCFNGVTHMYRRQDEAAQPAVAGEDPYAQRIPLARCLPFWGGISEGGFASVLWHETRKLNTVIWAQAGREGELRAAIRALSPVSRIGPWTVLADGETLQAWTVDRPRRRRDLPVGPGEPACIHSDACEALEGASEKPRPELCGQDVGLGP